METFHEDILQTFIFCFLASLGIIQIMVGIRGWHGLSIYGGRARKNVNNALGAALVIFAYAWYFTNPLHRNVRNIEGFMSLVCLVLGIIAAAAVTAVLASFSEMLRRRLARRDGGSPGRDEALRKVFIPGGCALLSPAWGKRGDNLVVIAEPGRGSEELLRRLYSALPEGRGFLSLQPLAAGRPEPPDGGEEGPGGDVLNMLARVEELEGLRLEGETFLGLGWEGSGLIRLRPELENAYRPCALLAVAPVIPDYSRGLVGDALLSNTPLDIGDHISRDKPWSGKKYHRVLRLWWPVLVACVIVATLVTFIFDIRWKLFSGPLVGLIISVWITYFLAAWRGLGLEDGGRERGVVSRMYAFRPGGGSSPLQAVVISEDCASPATLPAEVQPVYSSARLEFWNDVLRGKFLLKEGTMLRLVNLIWEGPVEGPPDRGQ
jgi:hypothetical protein